MNNKSAAAKVLEAIAAKGGGNLDMSALNKLSKGSLAPTQEANSVLRSLHKPHAYMKKNCKRKTCAVIFETNYCSMAYCSDECLAADMRDIGIVWDPFKMKRHESHMFSSDSNVLWRYEPPEYISTQTLDALEPVLRAWLADLENLREKASHRETLQREETLAGLHDDFVWEDEVPSAPVETAESAEPGLPLPVLLPPSPNGVAQVDLLELPELEDVDFDF